MNEKEEKEIKQRILDNLDKNNVCCGPTITFGATLILLLFLFTGCCSCKKIKTDNNSNHEVKDSVRVEYKYEKVTEYVHDTTYVTIPAQENVNHIIGDSSHLENQYCSSDAKINPDGTLYHNLKTKPQDIPVEFDKPVTTITESEKEDHTSTDVSENNQTITEYIERDYTWWDKTRFYASYILFGWLLLNYRKFFSKLLVSVIKKLFS